MPAMTVHGEVDSGFHSKTYTIVPYFRETSKRDISMKTPENPTQGMEPLGKEQKIFAVMSPEQNK